MRTAVARLSMKTMFGDLKRLRVPTHLLLSLFIQGLSVIIPFALVPFYARILGAAGMGSLAIAQSFSLIVGSVVDFGFHISGTRAIALNRENLESVSGIFADVQSAKLVMTLLVAAAAVVAAFAVPVARHNLALFSWSAAYGIVQGATLTWFFGGLQRQAFGISLDLAARLTALPFIFVSVHAAADAWKVQASFAVFQAIWIGVALFFAYRACRFVPLSWSRALRMFHEGRHIFFQHVVGMFYNSSTSLLFGLVSASFGVGIYAGAERIARMPLMPITPYRQIFFPILAERIGTSREQAAILWRRLSLLAMAVMVPCTVLLFVFAGPIVRVVLGSQFAASVPVLRTLAFLPVLVAAGELFGIYWLLPNKHDAIASRCLLACTIAHIIILPVLGFFLGAVGAASAVVLSQGLFVVLTALACLRAESGRKP